MVHNIKNPIASMDQLLGTVGTLPKFTLGELVEGEIIEIDKGKILVDLQGVATGIISGKDMRDSGNTAATLNVTDQVLAVVVNEENVDGLVVLSLRKASQQRAWDRFKGAYENKEIFKVTAQEANKGGLLLDIDGVKAFIPVSQLAPLHYPRVEGADQEKILQRLNDLVKETFSVRIINIDEEGKKLILSERAAMEEEMHKALSGLKIGQKVSGKISGIVSYGLFVTFDGLEGLVHISEIAWGHVDRPEHYGKVGDKVEVLVIGVDKGKISLSMKRLIPDPWIEIARKFKVGDVIDGKVTRLTNFGAFIQIEQDINGLVHLSEIAHEMVKDTGRYLNVGEKVQAKIITLDLDEHRIGLSIKALTPAPEGVEVAPASTEEAPKTDEAPKAE